MKRLIISVVLGATAMLAACGTAGQTVPVAERGPFMDDCPSAATLSEVLGKDFADPVHVIDKDDELAFEGIDCYYRAETFPPADIFFHQDGTSFESVAHKLRATKPAEIPGADAVRTNTRSRVVMQVGGRVVSTFYGDTDGAITIAKVVLGKA